MKDVKRCTRCILPESLPSVERDINGVCNYCRTYDRLFSNWEHVKSQRKKEFEHLLQRVKRLNRPYDCLIPLSGGKDSTYTLYLCNKIYGLKCLCVTFDNGFLSEYARMNIKNALKATGADHIFYSINRNILLKLYKLFLIKCGQFCPVCMRGIELSTEMAVKAFRIPLVVYGTGGRFTYLGFIPELFQDGDVHFMKKVVTGETLEKDVGPILLNFTSNIQKIIRITCELLRLPNPMLTNRIALYDYIDTNYDEIYNTIKQEMGWKKPVDQFEHMDCILHEIPFYIHTLKFPELTTDTLYYSGLIRLGRMTREEAMNLISNKSIKTLVPTVLDSFLREIGMSKDEFEASVRDWRKVEKFRKKENVIVSIYRRRIARV